MHTTSDEFGTDRQLPRELWGEYLDAVSRELTGAHVSVFHELSPSLGGLASESPQLQRLSYDSTGDALVIEMSAKGRLVPRPRLISRPDRLTVDNHTMLAPLTITIEDRSGQRTVVRIEREDDVAV
ncbi:MAG: DUF5335 family protein [Solirubrobacteraceae bacterium]